MECLDAGLPVNFGQVRLCNNADALILHNFEDFVLNLSTQSLMNFVFSLVQQNDLGLVVSNTVEVVSDAGRCLVSFECSSHHYDSFGFQYLVMTLGVGLSILEVENV